MTSLMVTLIFLGACEKTEPQDTGVQVEVLNPSLTNGRTTVMLSGQSGDYAIPIEVEPVAEVDSLWAVIVGPGDFSQTLATLRQAPWQWVWQAAHVSNGEYEITIHAFAPNGSLSETTFALDVTTTYQFQFCNYTERIATLFIDDTFLRAEADTCGAAIILEAGQQTFSINIKDLLPLPFFEPVTFDLNENTVVELYHSSSTGEYYFLPDF